VIKDAAPVARMTVTPTSGRVSLVANADASASTDTDGTPIAKYTFDFGDGSTPVTQTGAKLSHTFTTTGTFTVSVQAFDTANQASNKVNVKVTVSR
jgi:PKD repeat protein